MYTYFDCVSTYKNRKFTTYYDIWFNNKLFLQTQILYRHVYALIIRMAYIYFFFRWSFSFLSLVLRSFSVGIFCFHLRESSGYQSIKWNFVLFHHMSAISDNKLYCSIIYVVWSCGNMHFYSCISGCNHCPVNRISQYS